MIRAEIKRNNSTCRVVTNGETVCIEIDYASWTEDGFIGRRGYFHPSVNEAMQIAAALSAWAEHQKQLQRAKAERRRAKKLKA